MRRRLVLFAAAVLLLTGSHWPQGWHWPGPGAASSYDPQQTWVYFQRTNRNHDLYLRHFKFVDWAAVQWRKSPRVAIRVVERCPTNANCVRFVTRNIDAIGLTSISIGGNRHLLSATVRFHPVVGTAELGTALSREAACFESMLALGGGWDSPTTALNEHSIGCNGSGYPTAHDYQAIADVYDHLHG
jgi:hypothetical protein